MVVKVGGRYGVYTKKVTTKDTETVVSEKMGLIGDEKETRKRASQDT